MRDQQSDWPDLEAALFQWQQYTQRRGGITSGDILKAKAAEIWQRLPQYHGKTEPKWSNGWLEKFKRRHKIKEYVHHGEAGSAPIDSPEIVAKMENIRNICAQYHPRDIFNMDETGLYWKRIPDRSLATESQSGIKKSKDRITLALTANGDGTEKLLPWVIARSKNPRCFKNINRRLLGVKYRYNKTKWMTGLICEEFLRWFDNQMRGRKVLLLMDNFSAHGLATDLVGGLEGLENTRILWLPENTTSHWQPMDQGIIAQFKLHYRQQWISYMLRQFEANRNPNKTITLLHAVQWTTFAWSQKVTSTSIQKCFWKSTCISKPMDLSIEDYQLASDAVAQLQAQIALLPGISDPVSANEFIQPLDEQINDDINDIFDFIIESYSEDTEESEAINDEVDFEAPKVNISDAIKAIECLKLFELQQETGEVGNISALERIERGIYQKRCNSQKQTTLDSYF
jgi:DDE superfamily endonuclease/Tc5 transposase DNA-binding domain